MYQMMFDLMGPLRENGLGIIMEANSLDSGCMVGYSQIHKAALKSYSHMTGYALGCSHQILILKKMLESSSRGHKLGPLKGSGHFQFYRNFLVLYVSFETNLFNSLSRNLAETLESKFQ
ncbi:hypothetical protein ACB092_01G232200 [Castanea dentata]